MMVSPGAAPNSADDMTLDQIERWISNHIKPKRVSFAEASLRHLTDQELEIIAKGGQLIATADDESEKQSKKINGRPVNTGELQRGRP